MKKLIFVLACLMAVPAFALNVTLTDNLDGTIDVDYSDANATNLPSGFALTVTLTNGAVFSAGVAEMTGESTAGTPGYGIFPGTIDINDTTGLVDDDGSPVAPAGDPGGTGTGGASIVLELGALYVNAVNAPAVAGTLCTLTVDCSGATGQVDASVAAEATYRGGIVLEDAAAATGVVFTGLTDICVSECFPSCHPDYTEWQSVGEPNSWCTQRQCYGDADDAQEGNPKDGYFWVANKDLNALSAGWKQVYGGDPDVDTWIAADFDHAQEGNPKDGYFRVANNDLNVLSANWKSGAVPTDCLDCP